MNESSEDETDLFNELLSAAQQPSAEQAEQSRAQALEEEDLFNAFFEDSVGQEGQPGANADAAGIVQVPVTHWFGKPEQMRKLGSVVQVGMYDQFLRFATKNESLPNQDCGPQESSKGPPLMTGIILKNFVGSSTLKSMAVVAETTDKSVHALKDYLFRCGTCIVHGSAWIIGACLSSWRQLFRHGRFTPKVLVHKMRYDETPLKMKLQEYNQFLAQEGQPLISGDQQESRYCKILRLEWELGFLIFDKATLKNKFVTLPIPLPLTAVSRNTAECLVKAIDQAMSRLPELTAFENDFEHVIRLAVIDRFSANYKAERHIRSRSSRMISTVFACDVHKMSGCIKKGLSLTDDTLSGLVNLGLALEGSGVLSQMRSILQEIFDEQLVVVIDHPPDENSGIFQHRKALLDLFLPVQGPKSLKRRFILQTMCNSDVSGDEIIHYCSFNCCTSPDHTRMIFQKWVTWSLLPSKMQVLQRKSWTGSDVAVRWAGLLNGFWGLLPRVILRVLKPNKSLGNPGPGPSNPAPEQEANAEALEPLGDDPLVDDMAAFNKLLQD